MNEQVARSWRGEACRDLESPRRPSHSSHASSTEVLGATVLSGEELAEQGSGGSPSCCSIAPRDGRRGIPVINWGSGVLISSGAPVFPDRIRMLSQRPAYLQGFSRSGALRGGVRRRLRTCGPSPGAFQASRASGGYRQMRRRRGAAWQRQPSGGKTVFHSFLMDTTAQWFSDASSSARSSLPKWLWRSWVTSRARPMPDHARTRARRSREEKGFWGKSFP